MHEENQGTALTYRNPQIRSSWITVPTCWGDLRKAIAGFYPLLSLSISILAIFFAVPQRVLAESPDALAIENLLVLAAGGDESAQFQLGEWYRETALSTTNPPLLEKAVDWYRKAAAQGHLESQLQLGVCLPLTGRKDAQVEAQEWLTKAAISGDARAMAVLALGAFGENGDQSLFKWAEAGAYSGNSICQQLFIQTLASAAEAYAWAQVVRDGTPTYEPPGDPPPPAAVALGQQHYQAIKSAMQLGLVPLQPTALWDLARDGLPAARFTYAIQYLSGAIPGSIDDTSLQFLRSAAEKGYSNAIPILNELQQNGGSLTQETAERFKEALLRAERIRNPVVEQAQLDELRTRALGGDVDACFDLGQRYFQGNGVDRDYKKAFSWFSEAAKLGSIGGWVYMGMICENGWGVEKDIVEAIRCFRRSGPTGFGILSLSVAEDTVKASPTNDIPLYNHVKSLAEGGDHEAEYLMGLITLANTPPGTGSADNRFATAVGWLAQAADGDHPDALFNLALCYEDGLLGLDRDLAKAIELYGKAADLDHARSQYRLWKLSRRTGVTDGGREHGIRYLKAAATRGLTEAQVDLAKLHLLGKGVQKDIGVAESLLRKPAEDGDSDAQYWYGFGCDEGLWSSHDDGKRAVDWYAAAAAQGHAKAWLALAKHLTGDERIEAIKKAFVAGDGTAAKLLIAIAEGPPFNAEMASFLGFAYLKGSQDSETTRVPDPKVAADWFLKAGQHNHAPSQSMLSALYQQGVGVIQNDVEGLAWAILAAKNGERSALNEYQKDRIYDQVRLSAQSRAEALLENAGNKQIQEPPSALPAERGH